MHRGYFSPAKNFTGAFSLGHNQSPVIYPSCFDWPLSLGATHLPGQFSFFFFFLTVGGCLPLFGLEVFSLGSVGQLFDPVGLHRPVPPSLYALAIPSDPSAQDFPGDGILRLL